MSWGVKIVVLYYGIEQFFVQIESMHRTIEILHIDAIIAVVVSGVYDAHEVRRRTLGKLRRTKNTR